MLSLSRNSYTPSTRVAGCSLEMSHKLYIAYCFLPWLIYTVTLIDPWWRYNNTMNTGLINKTMCITLMQRLGHCAPISKKVINQIKYWLVMTLSMPIRWTPNAECCSKGIFFTRVTRGLISNFQGTVKKASSVLVKKHAKQVTCLVSPTPSCGCQAQSFGTGTAK
jgi:hypothetical protein